jgi:hypothetical protein
MASWRRSFGVLPGRAGRAAFLALTLMAAGLIAAAAPAGAVSLGWEKSSAPQMAKVAAAAKVAAEKKEKAEAAAAAAAAALAALEAQEAAQAERLLTAIGTQERQFWSLGAYSVAQNYVQRAEAGSRAAADGVQRAIGVWDVSKLDVVKAILLEKRARATVATYQLALRELGLAVYTGAATPSAELIGNKETQLAQAELAGVAAAATTTGLNRSKVGLARSIVNVGTARATVVVDWHKILQARQVQKAAIAQVALSRQDVTVARLWATLPGAAPAQPGQALAFLEGKFAPRHAGPDDPGPGAGAVVTSPKIALAVATEAAQAPPAVPDPPASLEDMTEDGPSILGPSLLSAPQIASWFASTGYNAHVTVPFGQLVEDYFKAAESTGVRADIAFAQSVIETGYFTFPSWGQDAPSFNNFAGIGACDSCKHGWSFPSAMTGVLSQEELLQVYATPPHLTATYGKPTQSFGIEGCCSKWMGLGGIWASSPAYGYDILNIYNQMLSWALPRELHRAGLGPVPPTTPARARPLVKSGPAPSRNPRT